jgi:hypothetical protein|tara:strand:+ start:935 stop:1372 length:438 start_codon:yes stop_codon:yes gene_type:complete
MSINYIKHEQEFYGVCKLISGETIIGSMIATEEDNEPGVTLLYVSDPAVAQQHSVEKDGQMGMAVGFIKWMMWSSEDFYIIEEKDILTVAPMSMESILMYKMWLRKECGGEKNDNAVDVNKNMGLVGKVSDARKKLEDIWKMSSG